MASRVREIHDALVSKKTSAREVLDGHLSIIKKRDLETHAFLDVHEERAYREAARVDEKIARGEKIDILAGIPVALKDNICVKGTRATAASKILEDYTAAYDAHVVEKLRLASAVIVGKTNLDEFAMGGSTENSAFGPQKIRMTRRALRGVRAGGRPALLHPAWRQWHLDLIREGLSDSRRRFVALWVLSRAMGVFRARGLSRWHQA